MDTAKTISTKYLKDHRMKETEIQKTILEALWYNKIFAWRNNNTPIYDQKRKVFRAMPIGSIKGVSDILGIMPDGRFLAIEVKKKGTYASKEQKEFLKNINDNGGLGFVARDLDDLKKYGVL